MADPATNPTSFEIDPVARTASVTYEFTTTQLTFPPTVPDPSPLTVSIVDAYGVSVSLSKTSVKFAVASISKGSLTVGYGVPSASGSSKAPKGANPWDDPAEISGNWSDLPKPLFKDAITGDPILMSNNHPPITPLTGYSSIAELVITRKRNLKKSDGIALGQAHSGKLNNAAFTLLGTSFEARTCLVRYTFNSAYYANGLGGVSEYLVETINIQYSPSGWQILFADEGLTYYTGTRGASPMKYLWQRDLESNIPYGYMQTSPSTAKRELGSNVVRRMVPFLLNGAGKPLVKEDPDEGVTSAFPTKGEAYGPSNPSNIASVVTSISDNNTVWLGHFDRSETSWQTALNLSYNLTDY